MKAPKRKYIVGICVGWFFVAIFTDHLLLKLKAPWYTRLIALEKGKVAIPPFTQEFSQLSFTTFLLVPFLISIITLVVLAARKRIKGSDIVRYVSNLLWYLSIIFFAVFIGHTIYMLISGIDWAPIKVLTNFCDKYIIEGKIYLLTLPLPRVESGIGAIAGLVIGIYTYYKRGVLKLLIEKAGLDLS